MKHSLLALLLATGTFTATAQDIAKDSLVIHFDFNKSAITTQAGTSMDSLLKAITPARLTQINLYGHCDFIGSHVYNDSLSRQRVQATRDWLVDKGVNATVFQEENGFGKRQPLDAGTTDVARAINRRVTIVFGQQAVAVAPPAKQTETVVVEMRAPDSPARELKPVTVTTPSGPSLRLNDRGMAIPDLSKMIADPKVKAGSTLTLSSLYFEGGRHYLMPQSYPILKGLLKAMQDFPLLEIEIQGHICCEDNGIDGFDSDLRTRDLSVQRAKAIYQYLIDGGIDKSRLSYRGFGSSQKIYKDEKTPEEQLKNRRVEIRILKK